VTIQTVSNTADGIACLADGVWRSANGIVRLPDGQPLSKRVTNLVYPIYFSYPSYFIHFPYYHTSLLRYNQRTGYVPQPGQLSFHQFAPAFFADEHQVLLVQKVFGNGRFGNKLYGGLIAIKAGG